MNERFARDEAEKRCVNECVNNGMIRLSFYIETAYTLILNCVAPTGHACMYVLFQHFHWKTGKESGSDESYMWFFLLTRSLSRSFEKIDRQNQYW